MLLLLSQLSILASSVKEAVAKDYGMPVMRNCVQTLSGRSGTAYLINAMHCAVVQLARCQVGW